MQYKIKPIASFLKEGMRIKTNIDGDNYIHNFSITGEIGEIILNTIYIFNNSYEGNVGNKDPKKYGYKYSWVISPNNGNGVVEFLNEKNESIYLTLLCSKCKNNVIIEPLNPTKNIFSDNIFCEECKNKFLSKCVGCGKFYKKEGIKIDKKGNLYCICCYDNFYGRCQSCEEETLRTSLKQYKENVYCQTCWEIRFGTCEICQNVVFLERLIFNEEYNITHCLNCNPKTKDIRNYAYRPMKWDFKELPYETKNVTKVREKQVGEIKQIEINERTLFMGVELEVEPSSEVVKETIRGNKNPLLNEAHKFLSFLKSEYLDNMFYLKYDSSINGFEIVTHPFSLKYSHKYLKWEKILKWLVKNNFTSYLNERCGLHVHLNKAHFNKLDLIKLRTFFSVNSVPLFAFSKRSEKMMEFAKYEVFNLSTFRTELQIGRHWALNINTDKNTVEIRIFRGTLSYERFIASLQFAQAVAFYVKNVGIGFLINNKDSWQHFIDWCKQETSYSHFVKYVLSKTNKGEN